MSKGATFTNDLLLLLFNGTGIANIADNAASSPATVFYAALHTADPGENGNQATNEVAYTGGYARVAINRNSGGFTVSGGTVNLTSAVNFAKCTGGTATATHFSLGMASSGTGKILYSGTLTPNISIANGVTPQLETGTTITED